MRFKIVAFAIMAFVGFHSCDQYEIVPPETEYESFSTTIQPIFNSDCVRCHSGNLDPNLTEGSSYASLTSGNYINTDDPEASKLYQKLMGSHDTYTSSLNKELILQWITEGAPND